MTAAAGPCPTLWQQWQRWRPVAARRWQRRGTNGNNNEGWRQHRWALIQCRDNNCNDGGGRRAIVQCHDNNNNDGSARGGRGKDVTTAAVLRAGCRRISKALMSDDELFEDFKLKLGGDTVCPNGGCLCLSMMRNKGACAAAAKKWCGLRGCQSMRRIKLYSSGSNTLIRLKEQWVDIIGTMHHLTVILLQVTKKSWSTCRHVNYARLAWSLWWGLGNGVSGLSKRQWVILSLCQLTRARER